MVYNSHLSFLLQTEPVVQKTSLNLRSPIINHAFFLHPFREAEWKCMPISNFSLLIHNHSVFCGWVITMNDSHLHLFPGCYWAFQNWHRNSFLALRHRSFINAVLWHCLEYVSVFTMFADATCLCCPSGLSRAANDAGMYHWTYRSFQPVPTASYRLPQRSQKIHPWEFYRRTRMVSLCAWMQWCSHGGSWGVLLLIRPAWRQGSFSQAQLGGKCITSGS